MSTPTVRSVTVSLKANVADYAAKMAAAGAATKKFTAGAAADMKRAAADVQQSTKAMGTATAKAVGPDAVKAATTAASAARKASAETAQALKRTAQDSQGAARRVTTETRSIEGAIRRLGPAMSAAQAKASAAWHGIGNGAASAAAKVTAASTRIGASSQRMGSALLASADRNEQAWTDMGTAVTAVSAGVALAAGAAVKSFMDFDAQMSRVGAAADASAVDLAKMRDAALEAGKITKYSATEAAVAQEELVKAGLSANDVAEATKASMDLAAAGQLELGEAAETAAKAMKTFELSGSDVGHIADVLAAAAGKAVGSVHEMRYAMSMSGLVAHQLGLSLEDTAGTLSAFADNALVGSDAGTSLKTMLSFMIPKSEKAAGVMRDLGLKFFDAQGRFVGITDAAGQLQGKLSSLTQEQRVSAMYTIFGSDAIRGANILYKEGAEGIQRYIDQVNDVGYAQRVAAKSADNLKGDLEKLKGALETSLIESGGGAAAGLRELTQAATKAVDVFSALPGPVRNGLTALGLVGGALGLAAGGFMMLIPRIVETRAAMTTLGITAASTRSRVAGLASALTGPWGIALAAATLAVGAWASKQSAAAQHVRDLTETLDQQTGALTKNSRELVANQLEESGILKRAKYLKLSLEDVTTAALEGGDAFARLAAGHAANTAAMSHNTDEYAQAEMAYYQLVKDLREQRGAVGDSVEAFKRHQQAMGGSAAATAGSTGALGENTVAAKVNTAATREGDAAVENMIANQKELKEALEDASNAFLDGRQAQVDYYRALNEAKGKTKEKGFKKGLDVKTTTGQENIEALDEFAKKARALLANELESTAPDKFNAKLAETRKALIQVAEKFGYTTTQAKKYADRVLAIPDAKPQIKLEGVTSFKAMIEDAERDIKVFPNAKPHIKLQGIASFRAMVDAAERKIKVFPKSKTFTLRFKTVGQIAAEQAANTFIGRYGPGVRRAEGGPIPAAAGSGVRDDVPALLTAGEYVVNRRATEQNYALLHAINSGRTLRVQGFATGGPVGPAPRPAPGSGGPRVVMVPVTETHTTTASVHVGQVVTSNPREFATWGMDRSFSATGGVR